MIAGLRRANVSWFTNRGRLFPVWCAFYFPARQAGSHTAVRSG